LAAGNRLYGRVVLAKNFGRNKLGPACHIKHTAKVARATWRQEYQVLRITGARAQVESLTANESEIPGNQVC